MFIFKEASPNSGPHSPQVLIACQRTNTQSRSTNDTMAGSSQDTRAARAPLATTGQSVTGGGGMGVASLALARVAVASGP